MSYRALVHTAFPVAYGYSAYGDGWRFSLARSVAVATSDRVHSGGESPRCPLPAES